MKKVIVTAPAEDLLIQELEKEGYQVDYQPAISYEALKREIDTVVGLIVSTRIKVDRELLMGADQLKWIGRLGSGMELIDQDYAQSRGIACLSSPEGNRNAVAEHSLGLLLSLMNNIMPAAQEVKQAIWKRKENTGNELAGKTVGIIGYGNTGAAFARLLEPFDVTVMAYDKYRDGFSKGFVREASAEQICRYADVISLHLPLTEETRHFANAEFFASMKQQPWFLSACRGGVTDSFALKNALHQNLIKGAGLDVIENENPATWSAEEKELYLEIAGRNNVILTPHIAGYSHEAFIRMVEVLVKKIRQLG